MNLDQCDTADNLKWCKFAKHLSPLYIHRPCVRELRLLFCCRCDCVGCRDPGIVEQQTSFLDAWLELVEKIEDVMRSGRTVYFIAHNGFRWDFLILFQHLLKVANEENEERVLGWLRKVRLVDTMQPYMIGPGRTEYFIRPGCALERLYRKNLNSEYEQSHDALQDCFDLEMIFAFEGDEMLEYVLSHNFNARVTRDLEDFIDDDINFVFISANTSSVKLPKDRCCHFTPQSSTDCLLNVLNNAELNTSIDFPRKISHYRLGMVVVSKKNLQNFTFEIPNRMENEETFLYDLNAACDGAIKTMINFRDDAVEGWARFSEVMAEAGAHCRRVVVVAHKMTEFMGPLLAWKIDNTLTQTDQKINAWMREAWLLDTMTLAQLQAIPPLSKFECGLKQLYNEFFYDKPRPTSYDHVMSNGNSADLKALALLRVAASMDSFVTSCDEHAFPASVLLDFRKEFDPPKKLQRRTEHVDVEMYSEEVIDVKITRASNS